MTNAASRCSQCGAPLPAETGTVTCRFCGAATVVRAPIGPTQLRAAVRQVLAEERAPAPTPTPRPGRAPAMWIAGAMAAAVLLGALLVVGMLFSAGGTARPHLRPPVPAPAPPAPPRPEPAKPPEPRPTFGEVEALRVSDDAVYVASASTLVKFDRATRAVAWTAKLTTGGGGDLVALKDRVVYANALGVSFHDAQTGDEVSRFFWRAQHFKVSACAAGAGVLVKTVFDGVVRFDATGKRVQGTASCALQEDLRCAPGEHCAWDSSRHGALDCRLELRTASGKVTFCREDGTRDAFVVLLAGGAVKWKTKRASDSDFADLAALVDGALVVSADHLVEAFDPASGAGRWSMQRTGAARALLTDGHRVWFPAAGAIVEVSGAGEVLARYPLD